MIVLPQWMTKAGLTGVMAPSEAPVYVGVGLAVVENPGLAVVENPGLAKAQRAAPITIRKVADDGTVEITTE